MKRVALFTIILSCIATAADAQITKGTVLMGGNLSTSFQKTHDEPTTRNFNIGVNPSIGFAYKDNHVGGFTLTYARSQTKSNVGWNESDTYGVGVFYRRYLPLGKGFYLFGQSNLGYTLRNADQYSHTSFNGQKTREQLIGLNLYPGVAFAVNKRIHLELGMNNLVNLNYYTTTTKTYATGFHSESKYSGISFSSNANPVSDLNIGFRIALGK